MIIISKTNQNYCYCCKVMVMKLAEIVQEEELVTTKMVVVVVVVFVINNNYCCYKELANATLALSAQNVNTNKPSFNNNNIIKKI